MTVEETVYIDFGCADHLYHAGETVPAGSYRNVETGRTIHMDEAGELPPSFDGHVAGYVECPKCWGDIAGGTDSTGNDGARRGN